MKLFLESNTKEELILLQVRNNLAHSKRFIYDPPMRDGKKWIAWYFGMVDEMAFMQEAFNKVKE